MSPELILINNGINDNKGIGKFDPVKNDIFSLGLTFLRKTLLLNENEI